MKRSPRTSPQCSGTNTLGIRCGHSAVEGLETCHFHSTEQERALALAARDAAQRASYDRKNNQPTEFPTNGTAEEFAQAVLDSWEFREYIAKGLLERSISPTILIRLMDYAKGWGKPVERVEHTGKDGDAIITEVRQVIVHVPLAPAKTEIETRTEETPILLTTSSSGSTH